MPSAALAILALAAVLTSCRPPVEFADAWSPEVVGVVADADLEGRVATYILDSGAEVVVDLEATPCGGFLDPGDLILYADRGSPSCGGLRPAPAGLFDRPDCFLIGGVARDEGEMIRFASGPRLPKADDFSATTEPTDDGYWLDEPILRFCVSHEGEVAQQGGG